MFRKLLDEGQAGDNVGALLRGVKREDIERGQVLAKPGSITPHTKFKAQVYVLSKDEGGRHTPFFKGYRPQFYFRTTDVTGVVELQEGVEMVMPGDNADDDRRADPARSPWTRACASPSARVAAPSAPASSPRSSSRRGIRPDRGSAEDPDPAQGVRPHADRPVAPAPSWRPRSAPAPPSPDPSPCPTEKNVYCVIRGPFKDKDSREHFEIRTHKRLIDIHPPTPKTVDSLMRLDLPAGVDIEIKL